jgi:hypothetical protein
MKTGLPGKRKLDDSVFMLDLVVTDDSAGMKEAVRII